MLPETADTALKLEQPIMHHLLQHFRQNFWHLVEQQMASQDTSRREGAELEQYSNYSTEQSNMYEVSSMSRLEWPPHPPPALLAALSWRQRSPRTGAPGLIMSIT